jgi:hypothetical protein
VPIIAPAQSRGIFAKLERAEEDIQQLNAEITVFLKYRPGAPVGDDRNEAVHKFIDFYERREVPPRFAVIAGEVAHNLRSALDYIAWALSVEAYRGTHGGAIAFPILSEKPASAAEFRRVFSLKIEGVGSREARDLIERCQPYNARDPLNNPLLIVHDLNRIDKHRALTIVNPAWEGVATLPLSIFGGLTISPGDDVNEKFARIAAAKKAQLHFTPAIVFEHFGGERNVPVGPALTLLLNGVRDVVRRFCGEFE